MSQFAEKWNFNPLRYRFTEAALAYTNIALQIAGIAYALNFSGWSDPFIYAIATLSFALNAGHLRVKKAISAKGRHQSQNYINGPETLSKTDSQKYDYICQKIDDFVEKSDLKQPVEFILIPREQDKSNTAQIMVTPSRYTNNQTHYVMINHAAFKQLSKEELAAACAHEIGHCITNDCLFDYNQISLIGTNEILALANIIIGDAQQAIMHMAFCFAGYSCYASKKSVMEMRADYNAVALNENADDFRKCLESIYEKAPEKTAFRKALDTFFFPYIPFERRMAHVNQCDIESRDFHSKYNILKPKT